MVKKATAEQMMLAVENSEARAYAEEVKYGAGSPIEVRQAAALLEQADNTKALTKAVEELCRRVQNEHNKVKEAEELLKDDADHLDAAMRVLIAMGASMEKLTKSFEETDERLVAGACNAFREEVFDDLAKEISSGAATATENALKRAQQTTYDLEEKVSVFEETLEDAQQELKRSRNVLYDLTNKPWKVVPGSAICIALIVAFVLSMVTSIIGLQTLKPAVQGKAVIAYSEDYKGALEATQDDLKRIQNELDAYKEAYPEGLTEELEHDLNLKNAKI